MKTKFVAGLIVLASVVSLTGCMPSGPKKYASIDDLVAAYEAAGQSCDWTETDQVTDALASGTCSDSSVLSLWLDSGDATDSANSLLELGTSYGIKVHLLVGPNWLINDPAVEELQKKLGGKIISG
jgi:predicted small lipoprotein YifL